MKNRLIAGIVLLGAVAAPAAAQNAAKEMEIKWSASGGLAMPMGNFNKNVKMGFGAGVSGQWAFDANWDIRVDASLQSFGAKSNKTTGRTVNMPGQTVLGLAVNAVYHDASELYYSAGLGFYNRSGGNFTATSTPVAGKVGSNGGVGFQLGAGYVLDAAKQWSVEAGIHAVDNASYMPIGVRYRF